MLINRYEIKRKFIYFLAKKFGIVEDRNKFCIPKEIYIEDTEYEDDKINYYYAVEGLQIFPIIKKVHDFHLGHCSLYRDYIRQKVNTKKKQQEDKEQKLKDKIKELQKELKMYDCIKNWGTKECHCACRCLGNDFCKDAEEKINQLKEEKGKLQIRFNNYMNKKTEQVGEMVKQMHRDECVEFKLKQYFLEIEKIIQKRQKEHYCYCDECSPFKEILQIIEQVRLYVNGY